MPDLYNETERFECYYNKGGIPDDSGPQESCDQLRQYSRPQMIVTEGKVGKDSIVSDEESQEDELNLFRFV
jgi:hypothetical protein